MTIRRCRSTAPLHFAPSGGVVVAALDNAAQRRRGRDQHHHRYRIPQFDFDMLLWANARSAASRT
jgi:hypothetical protein